MGKLDLAEVGAAVALERVEVAVAEVPVPAADEVVDLVGFHREEGFLLDLEALAFRVRSAHDLSLRLKSKLRLEVANSELVAFFPILRNKSHFDPKIKVKCRHRGKESKACALNFRVSVALASELNFSNQ